MKISGKNVTAIDLFCGIGGLSYGLKQVGIKVLAGIDINSTCEYSFQENIKAQFIDSDIRDISSEKLITQFWNNNDIRVLVGCAPCQPFSSHSNKIKNARSSQKWGLLDEFIRIIQETNPTIVSMENVTNLSNKEIFKDFTKALMNQNYFVTYDNIHCHKYGLAQKRKRLVLLASKLGKIKMVEPTHDKSNYVTVKEVIGNLPKINSGEISKLDPLHRSTKLTEINLRRIRASKPSGTWEDWPIELRLKCHKKDSGKTYKSVYGRMSWSEPAPTLTTQFYNFGTGRFGHPEQDRALSLREASLLQSFPSEYKFYNKVEDISISKVGIQIGNAVPIILGKVIGKSIVRHLKNNSSQIS